MKTAATSTPATLPPALLPTELRQIVKWSVAILGEIIEFQLGAEAFLRIESVRKRMAGIRHASHSKKTKALEETLVELKKLKPLDRMEFARSYTLMLELMNACENAYRTHRLRLTKSPSITKTPNAIYYVLTAHPTEARAPGNIAIFHEIQNELTETFTHGTQRSEEKLRALLDIAWNTKIVRNRKPRVQDEAEHIYSVLLRDTNLSRLLDLGRTLLPIYIRSWVGGDKDGHPGVDQKTMSDSLQLSRKLLLCYAKARVKELKELLAFTPTPSFEQKIHDLVHTLNAVSLLKDGDGDRIKKVHSSLNQLTQFYSKNFQVSLPRPLSQMNQLLATFPALVVPLELREDSGVFMSDPSGDSLAIGRMLAKIGRLARGANPCWYARGLIISMAQSAEHIETAMAMIQRKIGNRKMPVVPLFEQKQALDSGAQVVEQILRKPKNKKIILQHWEGMFEIMLGYSDSSKESGVIASRLAVIDAMNAIDLACKKGGVQAVFFHGSGGSIDRGGGSIQDQMTGLPDSALLNYKATVQGEMVERTFASPEIMESQLMKIIQIAAPHSKGHLHSAHLKKSEILEQFADSVKSYYQQMIHLPAFLKMVEQATPYPYLSALKIGSRPSKRVGSLTVSALRAIPWILCWTQTRILFPTWWGVGSAWKEMTVSEKQRLRKTFTTHGVFRSYVHALGFTLAKIELPIFELYLSQSSLSPEEIQSFKTIFRDELNATWKFFHELTGEKNPLWYRPWLGTSIELRAAMIHPLNLLELLAQQDRDLPLLRVSVTGIASGMLTTG